MTILGSETDFHRLTGEAPGEGVARTSRADGDLTSRLHLADPELGLQELVSYSAFWGGVVVPGLLVTALVLLPYLDRKRVGVGRWFARQRVVANTIFTVCLIAAIVFTVIGTFFRGPNWDWIKPWKPTTTVTEGH